MTGMVYHKDRQGSSIQTGISFRYCDTPGLMLCCRSKPLGLKTFVIVITSLLFSFGIIVLVLNADSLTAIHNSSKAKVDVRIGR